MSNSTANQVLKVSLVLIAAGSIAYLYTKSKQRKARRNARNLPVYIV